MPLKKLTKVLAEEQVAKIQHCSGDDEVAHSKEDDLMSWFIECVASGMYTKKESIEIANIVAKTKDIKFARWCA